MRIFWFNRKLTRKGILCAERICSFTVCVFKSETRIGYFKWIRLVARSRGKRICSTKWIGSGISKRVGGCRNGRIRKRIRSRKRITFCERIRSCQLKDRSDAGRSTIMNRRREANRGDHNVES